jgi:calcineurin-like phosphoesterase family protein
MKTFFTADTHFGHANIIKYCGRPFKDANEMDDTLIARWNSVVTKDDTVYHLGDFAFKNGRDIDNYFRRLNYKFLYILFGNHDKGLKDWWRRVGDGYTHGVKILPAEAEIKINGQGIILSHYAMRVWNKSHHGTWQLYGHSHGSLPDDPNALSIDVGVDCHNFYPVDIEQVKKIMSKKVFKPIDHHGKED